MNILITGATGFIGEHLVRRLLQDNHNVRIIARNQEKAKKMFGTTCELFIGDLTDKKTLNGCCENIDVVCHLAAQIGVYGIPREVYENVNVKATVDLLCEAKASHVKHFIFCSTPAVSRFNADGSGRLISETAPYSMQNEYARTKALAEQEIIKRKEDINFTILRVSYVYGSGDERRTAIYRGIKKKRFILPVSGKAYMRPTHVSDIINGFILALNNKNAFGHIINLGGFEVTVRDYLDTIAKITNSKLIKINIGYPLAVFLSVCVDSLFKLFLHREGFVSKSKIDFFAKDFSVNTEKAEKILGYVPQTTLQDGLEKTMRWASKNGLL